MGNDYTKNVFINCPYDPEYLPFLKVIIFVILKLGFNPLLALNKSNSLENRIDKIVKLISESQYSIHDISRAQASEENEIARFNMPFELGIDYGCQKFSKHHKEKYFLILDKDQYRYKKSLSDLSGVDIGVYQNDELKMVTCIRNWLSNRIGNTGIDSGRMIFENQYMMEFQPWFLEKVRKHGYDENNYEDMPIPEYINYIKEWLSGKNGSDDIKRGKDLKRFVKV